MDTKSIEKVAISEDVVNIIASDIQSKLIDSQIESVNKLLAEHIPSIRAEFETIMKNSDNWVKIENKDVFYNTDIHSLLPNFANFEVGQQTSKLAYDSSTFKNTFEGYTGELPTKDELIKMFTDNNRFALVKQRTGFNVNNNHFTMNTTCF